MPRRKKTRAAAAEGGDAEFVPTKKATATKPTRKRAATKKGATSKKAKKEEEVLEEMETKPTETTTTTTTTTKDEEKEQTEQEEQEQEQKEKEPEQVEKKAKVDEGEGEKEKTTREENPILEKGIIHFLYRPRVGEREAHGFDDVQRLFIVLTPGKMHKESETDTSETSEAQKNCRLITIGKKKLPEISEREIAWCFVEHVGPMKEIAQKLSPEHYTTASGAERSLEGVRPVGAGAYAIVSHHGHTHLAYVLELPEDIGDVQGAFNIEKEGSYILSIKNPEASGQPPGFGLDKEKRAKFPEEMQSKFRSRRFMPVESPHFLDFQGCEVLLIGASKDIVTELGHPGEILEEDQKFEHHRLKDDDVYKELRMHKNEHPPQPLHGKWI